LNIENAFLFQREVTDSHLFHLLVLVMQMVHRRISLLLCFDVMTLLMKKCAANYRVELDNYNYIA
jgi:hypothetical protein